MRRLRNAVTAVGLGCLPVGALAGEPEKLSSFQPLTIEDAYPTKLGSLELEAGFRWDRTDEGDDLFEPRPRLKLGALPGLQLSLAVPYRFGDASDAEEGDVEIGGIYQFWREQGLLPATALSASVAVPLGNREGTESDLTLAVSKSLNGQEDGPTLHLNLTWLHLIDGRPSEQEDRYAAVIGYSHPFTKNTVLVLDAVREEERREGTQTNLIEAGMRQSVGEDLVLSAGGGVGIGDDSPDFRVLVGLQRSFKLF